MPLLLKVARPAAMERRMHGVGDGGALEALSCQRSLRAGSSGGGGREGGREVGGGGRGEGGRGGGVGTVVVTMPANYGIVCWGQWRLCQWYLVADPAAFTAIKIEAIRGHCESTAMRAKTAFQTRRDADT